MFHITSLTIVQLLLVALGLAFQIVAYSVIRKHSKHSSAHGDEHHDHESFNLPAPSRKKRPSARAVRESAHDYYEMEKTPPGVRPGELPKTSKVKYFDGTKPPPAA